jgi:plastocyanin domain-containing protein
MAIYTANGVLVVLDSPITLNKLGAPLTVLFSNRGDTTITTDPQTKEQLVTINVTNSGYQPRYIKVRQGVPVRLTLKSNETYSCALAFVLKEFSIKTFLEATDTKTFLFTPGRTGKYTYTCSMGMYTGTLEVI